MALHLRYVFKKAPETWSSRRMFHVSQLLSKRHHVRLKKQKMSVDDIGLTSNEKATKKLLDSSVTFEQSQPEDPSDVWLTNPYKSAKKIKHRDQAKYAYRPKVDPMSTSLILFPGQGTQYVGMCKDLLQYPNVKEMYALASEILDYDILKISLEGPKDQLDQTKFQQPAIFLASLASVEKLRAIKPRVIESCIGTAGFSLGEITALTFAEALTFEDALRLIALRADLMQIASESIPSGMMTVFCSNDSKLGLACEVARKFCTKMGLETVDCGVANFLFPECKVIAGNNEALDFIIENKDDFKLKKFRRLNVSGAFHTELMKDAADAFAQAMQQFEVKKPGIPVYSNVTGKQYKEAHIKHLLPRQMYSPVRWEQTMHTIYSRDKATKFPFTYECGPGKSLKSILRMVNRKAWEQTLSTEEISALEEDND